jgi:hypothetical protein
MIRSKKFYMKVRNSVKIGVGGWFCYCCRPTKSSEKRHIRSSRRREARIIENIERIEE